MACSNNPLCTACIFVKVNRQNKIYEPAHRILVFIILVINHGSDKSVHPCSLTRAFAIHTQIGNLD